jgi:M61 glycyl aminopeptidase
MRPSFLQRASGSRAAALVACLCGSGAQAGDLHEYRIEIDRSMSRMQVEARFGAWVDTVTARSDDAGAYLLEVRDCGDTAPIRLRNQRMLLPVGGLRCMSYTVDLQAAASHRSYNRALAPGNVVVSPSLWLWRPRLAGDDEIRIDFELPPGMQVAVPWQPIDAPAHRYRLTRSPQSSNAPAVFGDFHYREVDVAGATLRVSLLRSDDPVGDRLGIAAIEEWLRATATDVTLAYGRFPNPSPQVVVIPAVDSQRSAVPYGRVVRDGGEAVELFVDLRRPLAALFDDWTATHEFSHLMLPYLEREHRWVSEGFAQYYQNVLLARSGAYDPAKAWRELYEGFERGRLSRPELSPNAAAERGIRSARMKIYWSGAALALMADVELRRRSGGAETLDDVLGRLQACCLPSPRVWTGPELFEQLDSLASHPVFMPLYRRYADTAGFPDARPLLERLGVAIANGELELRRGGELQPIRVAITKTDPEAARWREQLAAQHDAAGFRAGTAGSR